MRTLNLQFAVVLFAGLVGTGVGTFFLHRYQFDRISRDLLWQAEHAQAGGRSNDAISHAYRYLEFQPKDVEAIEQLATWLEKEPEGRRPYGEVVRLLNQALAIQPERDDLRRRVVALDLRLGQYGDCLDHLDRLLQIAPNDAELLRWLGECKQRTGRHSDAARAFEKAIHADPKQATSYIKYASLLTRQLGRPDEARRVLEGAVQVLPADASIRLALARLLRHVGNIPLAKAAINVAVSLAPNDSAVLAFAGELHQVEGDLRRARELFQQACDADPKNGRYECTLVWLMLCDGQTSQAVERILTVLRDHPSHIDAITLLGDVGATSGKPEVLERMIEEIARQPANSPEWVPDYFRARLLMYRGRHEEACAKLEQLRTSVAKLPGMSRHATYLIAQCHEQLGDRQAEVDAYRRLVEAEPGSGYYRIQFTRALARAGQFDKAVTEFRAAVESVELPAYSVGATTVELVERCQRHGAERALSELQRSFAVVRFDHASHNAVLAKVELLRLRRRDEEALRLADAFLHRNPDHAPMHAARIRIIDAMRGYDAASVAMNNVQSKLKDNVDLRIVDMHLRATHGRWGYQYGVLTDYHEPDANKVGDQIRELIELIACYGMVGDYYHVIQSLDSLRTARPDHVGVRAVLLTLRLQSGQQAEVDQLRGELVGIEGPSGWTLRRFDAERLVMSAERDAEAAMQAREALETLAKERPCEPTVHFLMGRLDEIENRATADDHYRAALDYGLLDQPIEGFFWAFYLAKSEAKIKRLLDSPLVERLRLEQDRGIIRPIVASAVASGRIDVADRLLAAHGDATSPQLHWLGRTFDQLGLKQQAEQAFAAAARVHPGQHARNREAAK